MINTQSPILTRLFKYYGSRFIWSKELKFLLLMQNGTGYTPRFTNFFFLNFSHRNMNPCITQKCAFYAKIAIFA